MNRTALSILMLAALCACTERDDSDPPSGHSGMDPLVDAKTGCQYLALSGPWGFGAALTPRMDADGKQVCGRKEAAHG